MPSIIIRFPEGDKEFRFRDSPLTEGDVIAHGGLRYRVVSSEPPDKLAQTVTVELDEDDRQRPVSRSS